MSNDIWSYSNTWNRDRKVTDDQQPYLYQPLICITWSTTIAPYLLTQFTGWKEKPKSPALIKGWEISEKCAHHMVKRCKSRDYLNLEILMSSIYRIPCMGQNIVIKITLLRDKIGKPIVVSFSVYNHELSYSILGIGDSFTPVSVCNLFITSVHSVDKWFVILAFCVYLP